VFATAARSTVTPISQAATLRQDISQPATPPAVFTSAEIARVQKHCRFAISALDYEDAEQARKELRAALAILGG
jgi:vacuolar protein sorting-associated protein VTA1